MEGCKHFWVERTDGWAEQCTAAICLICGEYGCRCKIKVPDSLLDRRIELFDKLGVAGNNHEIEKSLQTTNSTVFPK